MLVDVCTTQTSLLQSFCSPPARSNRGPNSFKHLLGEYRIAQNSKILYCDFAGVAR